MTAPIPIGLTLNQIGQIFVNVKDLDRAIAFYRDILGMTFLFQAPPNMAFFDCGGIRIMLGIADRPDLNHPASIIYYKVDDIEREAKLSAKQAKERAWKAFMDDVRKDQRMVTSILDKAIVQNKKLKQKFYRD